MIRVEFTVGKGSIRMLVDDDPATFADHVGRLAANIALPCSVVCFPIPPDVSGRQALYWYPPRTPPTKEKVTHDQANPPCLADADA